jgi:tetratricopeptide (TPR) repeat protein
MCGANDFRIRIFSRGSTCHEGAESHRKFRPFIEGAQSRAALRGWLLAFLISAATLGAAEKGALTGTILGPSKLPIPGAKVTITAGNESRQTVTADQNGRYSFRSVEPASYTLVVEAAGYQPGTRADVRVRGGTSTTVDLLLTVAAPSQPSPESQLAQPSGFYDDTQLKASGLQTTIDAAGYSSQAQSPRRLLSEGPSLSANPLSSREAETPKSTETEQRLRETLRTNPEDFDANHQLGEYYLSAANPAAGVPYLEKAQELKPGYAANEFDLARAYLGTKNAAKAQQLLRDLIRRNDTAEYHNLLGQAYEALNDPASALKELRLAAQMDPSEKNTFDMANELLLVTNSGGPAVEAFTRGVALFPNSVRMYIGFGIALYARNSYDAAIEALCHASDLDPSDPRPYVFLGKMYNASKGHADEVAKRIKRFMETNPDNPLAYYYGALCLWKGAHGDKEGVDEARVEALFKKSLALDPRSADAHLQLGILYHDQRREQDAISEFDAAIRLKPDDPDAHYHLAQAYLRTGDKERGQEELQLYEKLRAR